VVLVAAVVYTLGELVAGPVLATLAAESPPPELRGRYLATYQLSWNLATGIAPLLYAWLLDLGSAPAWLGLTAIALLGALATLPMRSHLEHAGRIVTNRAEPVVA
jgi:MFS family permease